MRNNRKLKKIGIRGGLLVSFLAFFSLLLLTLWIIMTVYLEDVYRFVKTQESYNMMSQVESVLASDTVDEEKLNELAMEFDARVLILDETGWLYYSSSDLFSPFSTILQIPAYYRAAVANGGSYMAYGGGDLRQQPVPDITEGSSSLKAGGSTNESSPSAETAAAEAATTGATGETAKGAATAESIASGADGAVSNNADSESVPEDGKSASLGLNDEEDLWGNNRQSLIYCKVVSENNSQRIIMLTLMITPVASVIATLRWILIAVTLLTILVAVVMAIVLSRAVSKPIVEMSHSAGRLARADYTVSFPRSRIREVSELSDTLTYATGELEKVEDLQNELIANVSHDLRTPLTMIKGYAEVMQDIPGEITRENLQVIIDETDRLSGLVGDLLVTSRIESGAAPLNRETYNLTSSIQKVLVRYNKLVEKEGYRVDFIADGDFYVDADESQIFQVIYNLINNAINYTDDRKWVEVIASLTEENEVKVEIKDYGNGIAEADLPHVWDRYYRSPEAHKRAKVGTGLGLSIVKKILEAHGARYGVESRPSEGTTFWFCLPLVRAEIEE